MPIAAKCPTCEHSYNVPDGQRGKRVRCRNCADIFVVGGSKGREDEEAAEVELAHDPDESPRKKKKGSSDNGDLRSRLDREDLKPKGRKRSPDRDDDDEDDDRPRRKKSGEGSLLPLLLGIGGVVLLMLMGGAFAVYWSMSRVVQAGEDLVDKARQDIIRNQGNGVFNPPPPGVFNPPVVLNPPGPVRRSVFDEPKNIDEALEDIDVQFNDVFVPKARAEWLAKQVIDEGRRKEVCDALWKLSQTNPHHFTKEAGTNGFCKWAGPAQGDQLLQLVEAGNGNAMEAAVRLKLPKLAPALCKKLTDWSSRGNVMRHLEALGTAAEKDVMVYLNHSDDGLRRDITNLLKKWNTKTDVIVDQCVLDLASTKMEVAKASLERLVGIDPKDSSRKDAVVKAVRPLIASTQRDIDRLSVDVALKWGTADIAPDLIAALEKPGNSFDKRKLMDALKEFNTEPCRQAIVRQLATPGVNFQASGIIRNGGDEYEPAVLEFLRTTNNQLHRMEAVRLLEVVGTMKSIPTLQQVALADRSMQLWATKAAQAIQKRGK